MKSYEEIARGALARAKEEKRKQKRRLGAVISVFAVCVAVAAAVLIPRLPRHVKTNGQDETVPDTVAYALGQEETAAETFAATGQNEITAETFAAAGQDESSSAAPEASDARSGGAESVPASEAGVQESVKETDGAGDIGVFGGETGELTVPAGFTVTGEAVTDADAEAYFGENLGRILSSLTASGVGAENARIVYPGYCHMNLGETGEVRTGFRDYLLYNGETLVSIITLYRVDGEIQASPAFGAPWFADYAAFLRAHRGERLLFFYDGFRELALTPQNELFCPITGRVENPGLNYTDLYCPEICFTPES